MASLKIGAQKFVLVALLLAVLFQVCASQQKICGTQLADTLKMICRNKYNSVGKKSVSISEYYDDDAYNFEGFESMPFLNKLYAGAMSPHIRRVKQGIVNECCKKSCTFDELSAYCSFK